MTVPAPDDAALPALGLALDGEAMRDVLQRGLGETFELEACRPCYVRYKPGTNVLVKYELDMRGETEAVVAHARLFADGTADRIVQRRSLQRLVERARKSVPTSGVLYLSELPAVVQLYPVDLKLPALATAVSPEQLGCTLRQAGLDVEQPGPPELIRYKPTRKALLRLNTGGRRLYLKLHADTRGARHLMFGDVLRRSGFTAAAPLLYDADLRMLVHSEQAGKSLRSLRATPQFVSWMEPLAETLGRLHSTRLEMLPARTAEFEARRALDAADSLAALLPDQASEIRALGHRLAGHLEEATVPPAPVHGDFWDDQALIGEQGLVLLDFDELRLGDPLVDVANLLAQLAVRQGERVHEHDRARATFLEAYAAVRPDRVGLLALHEAAALLRSAVGSFRRLEPGWRDSAARVAGLAADRLRGYEREPKRLVRPRARGRDHGGPRDPALPQLEELFDSGRMAEVLEHDVLGEPVTVHATAVVSHERGQGCTIRYELGVGRNGSEQPLRLYGKTFASSRGARVHELLCDIAEARPFGLEVGVPAPIAYLAALELSLCRPLDGEPIAGALVSGDCALAVSLAEALYRLHRSRLDLGHRHTLDAELQPLRTGVHALGGVQPEARRLAEWCLATIEARGRTIGRWRRRPVHRRFDHSQVLHDGGRLSILDLDEAAMADPALDVASFLAQLRVLALEQPEASEALSTISQAFGERYRSLDKRLDSSLVELLTAVALLRLATIHGTRQRGKLLAQALLDECHLSLRPA